MKRILLFLLCLSLPEVETTSAASTVPRDFDESVVRGETVSKGLASTVVDTPTITSSLAATGRLNQSFSYQIVADNQPTRYTVGGLPVGLSVNADTGLISGLATVPGTFSVTLIASNAVGSGTAILMLKVGLPDTSLVTLHSFQAAEAISPIVPPVQARDGNFYGSTVYGAASNDGTVYRMLPDGTVTVLHAFAAADGYPCNSGVIQAADGNLYGVTAFGGANRIGTIFRLLPDGTLTTLHTFGGAEGGESSGLILASDGNFYGMTRVPADGYNTISVYKIAPDGAFAIVHSISASGIDTVSPLIQAADGNLYGSFSDLFSADGAVFRCTLAGEFGVLCQFSYQSGNAGGLGPGALMQASDGNLYGTTSGGGANGDGTIFRLALDGTLTTLHHFSVVEGAGPSRLLQASDGNLYGVASGGGDSGEHSENSGPGKGTVFVITPDGYFTVLHLFDGTDGINPSGGLVQGSDGNLYGATGGGGVNGAGTIFRKSLVPVPTGQTPTVSLSTTTPKVIVRHGEIGLLNLTLTNAVSTDLVVHYTVKGSAVNGTDYTLLKGTAKIKAGRVSKTVKVTPLNALDGSTRRVKVTLAAGDGYLVGTTTPVKINIVGSK